MLSSPVRLRGALHVGLALLLLLALVAVDVGAKIDRETREPLIYHQKPHAATDHELPSVPLSHHTALDRIVGRTHRPSPAHPQAPIAQATTTNNATAATNNTTPVRTPPPQRHGPPKHGGRHCKHTPHGCIPRSRLGDNECYSCCFGCRWVGWSCDSTCKICCPEGEAAVCDNTPKCSCQGGNSTVTATGLVEKNPNAPKLNVSSEKHHEKKSSHHNSTEKTRAQSILDRFHDLIKSAAERAEKFAGKAQSESARHADLKTESGGQPPSGTSFLHPVASVMIIRDIIIIIVVCAIVAICCCGFGYNRYSRSGVVV